ALLSSDNVSFTFTAVNSWSKLVNAVEATMKEGVAILPINCGGNRSLRCIKVPNDAMIYGLDSRRVIHSENVHGSKKVPYIMLLITS
uniref:AMP-binding domain-containing protein n=1 Tax=Rhabditophanes sp. KR3021 TaxID=114890 RepID=A0AC35UFX6_9BILA